MKKTLLVIAMMVCAYGLHAQAGSGFGIKAGLNYNANGDYFESAGNVIDDPDRNVGYHVGFYGKLDLPKIYIRPEIVFTRTSSDYDGDDFDMSKLDVPLLLGYKFIGPLHVFGGPAFQYIIDAEFDDINIDDVSSDFTVGLNLGIGINIKKIGLDVRYERGFSDNEAEFINDNITSVENSRIDTRPDQLILSLSYKL